MSYTYEFRGWRGHGHVLDDHWGPETTELPDHWTKRPDDKKHDSYASAVGSVQKIKCFVYVFAIRFLS